MHGHTILPQSMAISFLLGILSDIVDCKIKLWPVPDTTTLIRSVFLLPGVKDYYINNLYLAE